MNRKQKKMHVKHLKTGVAAHQLDLKLRVYLWAHYVTEIDAYLKSVSDRPIAQVDAW